MLYFRRQQQYQKHQPLAPYPAITGIAKDFGESSGTTSLKIKIARFFGRSLFLSPTLQIGETLYLQLKRIHLEQVVVNVKC